MVVQKIDEKPRSLVLGSFKPHPGIYAIGKLFLPILPEVYVLIAHAILHNRVISSHACICVV